MLKGFSKLFKKDANNGLDEEKMRKVELVQERTRAEAPRIHSFIR